MAQKFYVVWSGRQTGVFTDWATTQRAVDKYAGARFKSFPTRAEAEQALRRGGAASIAPKTAGRPKTSTPDSERAATHSAHQFDVSIYCDGACEPNPGNAGSGIVVYRAGELAELWFGLYNPMGTNNTRRTERALSCAASWPKQKSRPATPSRCAATRRTPSTAFAVGRRSWEKKGWKKPGGEIKNLEIIQDCYAIYRRIEEELKLTHVAAHVGTEGNELADRMAMLGVRSKEKELRLYQEAMDIPTLLKMQAG